MRRTHFSAAMRALVLTGFSLLVGCYMSHGDDDPLCTDTCAPGTIQVERCVGDTPCYEESFCGAPALCADDICEPSAPCYGDESEVPFCEESSASCRARISCGQPLYCQSNLCDAFPSCVGGERVVASCEGEGTACRSVSVCGSTIYCASGCDVGPACDPGQTEYSECPFDVTCEAHTSCGETIYCHQFIEMCDAEPSCETYEEQVSLDFECDADHFCRFVEVCGITILCESPAVIAG